MEILNPFENNGNWYKGNTHLHTTNSDGTLTPEEICEIYKNAGYNFISITDHGKITSGQKFSDFLLIPGVELNKGNFHVVGINIKENFSVEKLSFQEIITGIKNQDALPVIAHPYWSGFTSQDLLSLNDYVGIEVYNTTCHSLRGKGYSSVHWDEILQTGRKVFGFAADDGHHPTDNKRDDDILVSFIMVKSKSLDTKSICDSIKNGLFYSSTGVIVDDLKIQDKKIVIKFSPAYYVDFIGYNASGKRISGMGKEITSAEYLINGDEKYIRIEITDKNNKKAWLNPFFI